MIVIKISWFKLGVSILITEGAGAIGSLFTFEAIPTWYASLNKSPITPPNWLFAPMWLTLFLLMGLALYIIWNNNEKQNLAFSLFAIQLVLNVFWSFLFFGQKQILFGAIEIVFLWYFILATVIEFRTSSKVASYLLFPYLAWVTVATVLNVSILWLNA